MGTGMNLLSLNAMQMDDFCVKLDMLMSAFSPSIKHDRYTVRVLCPPSLFNT